MPSCHDRHDPFTQSMEPVSIRFVAVIINFCLTTFHKSREGQIRDDAEEPLETGDDDEPLPQSPAASSVAGDDDLEELCSRSGCPSRFAGPLPDPVVPCCPTLAAWTEADRCGKCHVSGSDEFKKGNQNGDFQRLPSRPSAPQRHPHIICCKCFRCCISWNEARRQCARQMEYRMIGAASMTRRYPNDFQAGR